MKCIDWLDYPLPVLGFAAWSGTGKTTLLKQVIPLLKQKGIRVACLKHAHHQFDVDTPGKDSYELRHAGAEQMLIASAKRWALMTEKSTEHEPELSELLPLLSIDTLDLVLVEGFKQTRFPKIELHRADVGKALLYHQDSSIIAIATDEPRALSEHYILPVLNLNDPQAISDFIGMMVARHTQESTCQH